MHFFIYGAFYASLTMIAVFVDAIGAELTTLAVGITAVKTNHTASAAMKAEVCRAIHAVIPAVFAEFYAVFTQAAFMAVASIVKADTAFGTVECFLVHKAIKAAVTAGIAEFRASFANTAVAADKLVAVAFDALIALGTEPSVFFTAERTMFASAQAPVNFQISCITSFTDQISVFFKMAVIPEMVSAF